jgi:NHS family xanthosine MFS transporter
MIMTNGIGATVGTLGAQAVVNNFVPAEQIVDDVVVNGSAIADGWGNTWLIFAGYALVVAVAFMLLFRYKHEPEKMANFKH